VARVEKSIVVHVPAPAAYRHWTAYEEYPRFFDGVTGVSRADGGMIEVEAELAGRPVRARARVEEQPERRIAWHAVDGGRAEGEVDLRPVEGAQTLVTLCLDYTPAAIHDAEGAQGMVGHLVETSLERFKSYAESFETRRLAPEDEPPPRGAETVQGPQGELGAAEDPEAGELPLMEPDRHRHGMLVREEGEELLDELEDGDLAERVVGPRNPPVERDEPSRDRNEVDNTADWSRTR